MHKMCWLPFFSDSVSSPEFIFVPGLPDYNESPVASLDIDGFEESDNIKFIFCVHMCVSVCDWTMYQCFLLDCLRSISKSQGLSYRM